MNCVDDGSGVLDGDSLTSDKSYRTDSILSIDPASVEQPDVSIVLLDFLLQQLCIESWVARQEGLTEASRKCCRGFVVSCNNSCHIGCVAADEVVHGLCGIQFRDWR